ncbi:MULTISPECIES: TetR family transcriptional regulator [Actinoalloteichus]|uniref:Transcriptional regulator, TetR family n=1 Tax=Actinoalloteichus fjordicus TaxID=1612552 RepID=A0AAC9LGQ9_9PSEU|nr:MULTISPECIES: TetR family transcriptional regulator [Actinoalloteichus]APU16457.1 transcriptional regulator, TetR family [Actinoalloteichus fjordicus]APU22516.1 transcriptional regulator, TetR family [Actinoalloteichus sp. GBA129-24]
MKARIRDAAILLFGRNGVPGTSVRAVAEQAGASPALVMHHFGTKDALRAVCDQHVLDAVFDQKDDLASGGADAVIGSWLADLDGSRPLLDYLARMLVDDTEAGASLFDQLVTRTESMLAAGVRDGTMRQSSDPPALAAVLAVQGVAPLLLHHHLRRVLGGVDSPADVIRRLTVPLVELYTRGLHTDETILTAARRASAADDSARPSARDRATDGTA